MTAQTPDADPARPLLPKRGLLFMVAGLVVAISCSVLLLHPGLRARVLGVPLWLTFRQGQEERSRLVLQGTLTYRLEGLPPELAVHLQPQNGKPIPFEARVRTRRTVKSLVAGGGAEIETRVESIELKALQGKFSRSLPAAPASTSTLDRRGRVVEAAVPVPGLSQGEQRRLDAFLSSITGSFLSGDRKRPGERWAQDIRLVLDEAFLRATLQGRLVDRLVGVAYRQGAWVADLASEQEVTVRLAPSEKAPAGTTVEVEGAFRGRSRSAFDWRGSQVMLSAGQGNLDLRFKVRLPPTAALPRGGLSATGRLEGKGTYRLEPVSTP